MYTLYTMTRKTALQIRLDPASEQPAYRQIADQLRTLIVEGHLVPGDPLPAVRKLAMDLAVHFNTVAEAYRTLEAEEFLEITHGHGARVAERGRAAKPGPDVADTFRRRLRDLIAGMRARGLSRRQIANELRTIVEALEGQ
jgi:GntR family transcriptional regulator